MENYYQKDIECASQEQIRAWQDERIVKQVHHVWDNVPYYRAKMQEKGVTPDDIRGIADLHKLPFTSKADLRDAYPDGLLAVPKSECVRIHSTSGTTGKRVVAFYTQADVDNIAANGLSEKQSASTSQFLKQGNLPEFGTPVADIEEILTVGEKYDDVIIAGSIAELAEKLGCDEAVLSESLGGVDTKYYAVANAGWSYATVGGLDVDVNMNVLTEAGEPIINLFAVGQDSEGVCNVDGKAYSPWGGQAQSWTFVSGQIAGTFAAQYGLAQ